MLLEMCVVALARLDIAPCDTDCSLSQFILDICWYCRYANPTKSNPTTIRLMIEIWLVILLQ
jgi:hypothetical protein